MRTMYDSVTASDIPASAAMVAGYDTGPYAWSSADWNRFPDVPHVHIDTQASPPNTGQVLDVEEGDATPAQAPGWVVQRRAAGADPTIYCNASTWPAVIAAFRSAGVAQPHYWIAKYDNVPSPMPSREGITAVAKQYADPGTHGRGHFDLTSVPGYWPGIDPEDDEMSEEADRRVRNYVDAKISEVLIEVRNIRHYADAQTSEVLTVVKAISDDLRALRLQMAPAVDDTDD
jgi:hypothetical protein